MEIYKCLYCRSSSLKLVAIKIKRTQDKSIEINDPYITIKDVEIIKHFFKCNMCTKYSEHILTNKKGFVVIDDQKHKDTTPKNEILAIEESETFGGRFN